MSADAHRSADARARTERTAASTEWHSTATIARYAVRKWAGGGRQEQQGALRPEGGRVEARRTTESSGKELAVDGPRSAEEEGGTRATANQPAEPTHQARAAQRLHVGGGLGIGAGELGDVRRRPWLESVLGAGRRQEHALLKRRHVLLEATRRHRVAFAVCHPSTALLDKRTQREGSWRPAVLTGSDAFGVVTARGHGPVWIVRG